MKVTSVFDYYGLPTETLLVELDDGHRMVVSGPIELYWKGQVTHAGQGIKFKTYNGEIVSMVLLYTHTGGDIDGGDDDGEDDSGGGGDSTNGMNWEREINDIFGETA